ncbi:MAG: hypothetical protein EOP92_44080, partial [Lysobacteraceae bacterium]
HQVRVQFAWQRGQGSNQGGLAHDVDEQGSAPGDERSGTWVRVAEALAGPNWGSQFTPRIGTEVLVDFIENDIDRPLVVAQLYTGADVPPFPAGVDSTANHAGTISGIHTRGFDGGGYNQWQLDDTQGQLRMRLASSSANTQLNLGYLVQQSPGNAQRGAYRGSGFELRTDAWAVVRGAEGVLLTTHARAANGSGVTSTQMDASESLAALKAARELDTTLLDAATAQHALSSKASAGIEQVLPTLDGKLARAGKGNIRPFQRDRGLSRLQHDLLLGLDLDAVVHRHHHDFPVRQYLQLVGMRLQRHRPVARDRLDPALVRIQVRRFGRHRRHGVRSAHVGIALRGPVQLLPRE